MSFLSKKCLNWMCKQSHKTRYSYSNFWRPMFRLLSSPAQSIFGFFGPQNFAYLCLRARKIAIGICIKGVFVPNLPKTQLRLCPTRICAKPNIKFYTFLQAELIPTKSTLIMFQQKETGIFQFRVQNIDFILPTTNWKKRSCFLKQICLSATHWLVASFFHFTPPKHILSPNRAKDQSLLVSQTNFN